MKLFAVFLVVFVLSNSVLSVAQEENEVFVIEKELPHLSVISQGSTGTCWSFATTSFLESEIIRKGYPAVDLSEMFFVYHNYKNKAFQYLLYHGNNNFGQGSLSHDVIKILDEKGMITQESFPGILVDGKYRHGDLMKQLREELNKINTTPKGKIDVSDLSSFDSVLKQEIGKLPKKIKTEKGNYSPIEFRDKYNINSDDYVELTSYNHHPFYQKVVVEVPDNWAHELYFNIPIDELMEVMHFALDNGYSIAWDGDTSEKTFQHKNGKADVDKKWTGKVDQDLRQKAFYNRTSTDDHLMHIVGLSKDSEGKTCFYTKNSWGAESNEFGGYLHMSEDYVRLKTIGILLHKDAIPESVKSKLDL